MLYLAIDLHSRQLTVNTRNEDGTVLVRRQISTAWEKVRAFFAEVREQAAPHGGFCAIVEVCGFEDWLLKMLKEYGCLRTPNSRRSTVIWSDLSGLLATVWKP